jgi:hypothetical protein
VYPSCYSFDDGIGPFFSSGEEEEKKKPYLDIVV